MDRGQEHRSKGSLANLEFALINNILANHGNLFQARNHKDLKYWELSKGSENDVQPKGKLPSGG